MPRRVSNNAGHLQFARDLGASAQTFWWLIYKMWEGCEGFLARNRAHPLSVGVHHRNSLPRSVPFWYSYSCFLVGTPPRVGAKLTLPDNWLCPSLTLPLWYLMTTILILLRAPVMNSSVVLRDEVCVGTGWQSRRVVRLELDTDECTRACNQNPGTMSEGQLPVNGLCLMTSLLLKTAQGQWRRQAAVSGKRLYDVRRAALHARFRLIAAGLGGDVPTRACQNTVECRALELDVDEWRRARSRETAQG